MNSGPTSERIYDALKRRILTREFRPGDRLDPAALAETLSSSVTPVRDVLHILTGEGLVETGTSEGFHTPQIDEPSLQDLYDWNAEVLLLALRSTSDDGRKRRRARASGETTPRADIADSIAAVFAAAGAGSVNVEHGRTILALNDRLHAARLVEPTVLTGLRDELAALRATLSRRPSPDSRKLITAYHRRRRHVAAEIARALHRAAT